MYNVQRCFRRGKSTTSNLLVCILLMADILNKYQPCNVVITDFIKNFRQGASSNILKVMIHNKCAVETYKQFKNKLTLLNAKQDYILS